MFSAKDYYRFSEEDLVKDPFFIKWVRNHDSKCNIFWQSFLKEYPDKKHMIENAKHIVEAFQYDTISISDDQVHVIRKNIINSLRSDTEYVPLYTYENHRNDFYKYYYKFAAILGGLVVLGSIILLLNNISSSLESEKTAFGESKTIALPDKSTVVLNANSLLKYSKNWDNSEVREIWLEGEAYFDVKHLQSNKKFIVHTKGVSVEVLGTTFNVTNRHQSTRVVLADGKVKLNLDMADSASKELFMKPGDYVTYSEQKKAVKIEKVDPKVYTSWVQKRFLFNNTPLSEIAQLLEDNYGYTVRFGNSALKQETITGEIPAKNPEVILHAISESLDLQILKNNESISINYK